MKNYVSLSALAVCLTSFLAAQPSGMEVVSGQAESSSPSANVLQVQASDRAIIQWDRFSVDLAETMKFVLPDAGSAVLNRVTGGLSSEIMGVLQSNGQVFLVNPQGVFVGANALVDTAGFVASTFDVLNEEFIAKNGMQFGGDSGAAIVNLGTIKTEMGNVFLFAQSVKNEGKIEAANGTAGLAAGTKILLNPEGSKRIFIQADLGQGSVENKGDIQALFVELQADGNPYASAIRHDGKIDALGVSEQNGRVMLVAEGGRVDVTGEIRASKKEGAATCEEFGEVRIVGRDVYLTDEALIDVSNSDGGGLVRIGFDEPRALGMVTTEKAQIKADALVNGHGGKVLLWGTDAHLFLGTISARGGEEGGDGGFVDLSTKGPLVPNGLVYTNAPNGRFGELLLDPTDVQITTSANNNVTTTTSGGVTTYNIVNPGAGGTPPAISTNINIANLVTALASNNVTISTSSPSGGSTLNGTIVIGDSTGTTAEPITWSAATTLTLFANQDIWVYNQITNSSSATGFTAINFSANRDIAFAAAAAAAAGLGPVVQTTTGGGSINLTVGRNLWLTGAITTATGVITAAGATNGIAAIQAVGSGNVTITANNTYNGTSFIEVISSSTGAFSSSITTASGALTINAAGGGTLPTSATIGAMEVIAGTTAQAQIDTTNGGAITINTGVYIDSLNSVVTSGAGSVFLTAGAAAGVNAVIINRAGGNLTMNVLNGNVTIGNSTPSTAAAFSASIQQAGTTGNYSLYIDGNLTVASSGLTGSTTLFGTSSAATDSSTFNMTVTRNMTLTGGTGAILVGKSGGTGAMNLTVNGNVTMTGTSATASATGITNQIAGNNGGTINIGGNLTMTCGGQATGAIGVYLVRIAATGGTNPLNLTVGGNILMNLAAGYTATNQGKTLISSLSTGGLNIIGNGSMTLSAANAAAVAGTTVNQNVAQVYITSPTAPMVINVAGDIAMTPGTNAAVGGGFTCAQIGDPTTTVSSTSAGTITVNAANLILNSGAGNTATGNGIPYSAVGYGSPVSTAVSQLGAITINTTGSVYLNSSATASAAFTQIGHVTGTGNTITVGGNITVNAANVFLNTAGTLAGEYAVIGHGQGTASGTVIYNAHTVQVAAIRNVILSSGTVASPPVAGTGTSMIQNRSATTVNAITVICDNGSQTAPDYGTGYFSFGTGSLINATGTGALTAQVRIYTSVRVFNTVAASGQTQYSALPINGDTPSALTYPGTLGTNSVYEVWGTWAIPTTVGGGATYPGSAGVNGFVFYYKRTGGLLISDLASVGATTGTTYTFSQTEPRIQASTIQTQLGITDVTINADTIPNSSPTTTNGVQTLIGNSILWKFVTTANGQNISWSASNLTLQAENDIAIVDASLAITTGAIVSMTLNAGRDIVVGTGIQSHGTGASLTTVGGGQVVVLSTGRDLVMNGSAVFTTLNANQALISVSAGPTWNIGRDMIMNSSQNQTSVVLPSVSTLNVGRNVVQNGGSATGALASVQWSGVGTINIGGIHSVNGGAGTDAYAGFNEVFVAGAFNYNNVGGVYLTGGSGQSAGGLFGGGSAILRCAGTNGTATWNVTNGNVVMTGGASGNALIQLGSGSTIPLHLNVANGSILMQGSSLGTTNGVSAANEYTYGNVEIHAFAAAAATTSGALDVNVAGDLRMTGGAGPGGAAYLRAPGFLGTTTSAINLNVLGNLILQGGGTSGTGVNAVAQIQTNNTGGAAVEINVGGDLVMTGGAGNGANARIASNGAITAVVIGNALLTGGSNLAASAIIAPTTSVTLAVGNQNQLTGDLILTAGTSESTSAGISGTTIIVISSYGNLLMTSNAATVPFATAFIGSTTVSSSPSIILSLIGGDLVMTANGNNPVWIGNGTLNSAGGSSYGGAITLSNVVGDIVLNGSSLVGTQPSTSIISTTPLPDFTRGFAKIGHLNSQTETTPNTINGNITLTCSGSLFLNGGTSTGSRAQIGHGGSILENGVNGAPSTSVTDTYTAHTVTVNAGRNIVLNTTSAGVAQVVNFTTTGTAGNIVLIADNTYATSPNSGPGYFSMSSGSFLLTAPNVSTSYVPLIATYVANPLSQVKIYTAVRIFDTFAAATINGGTYTAGSLGVTNSSEQWGIYSPNGTNTNIPFGLYYKRVGGLLISSASDNGLSFSNGVYTFTKPEVNINSANLGNNLGLESVSINSSALTGSPLGSSANSILVTGPIGWISANTLTINSSQDLVLDNKITSNDTSGSAAVTLNATRNIFLGDAAQTAVSGVAMASAPLTITAAGQFNMYGSRVAASASSTITGGATINAATGSTLHAASLSFSSSNVVLNVLSGDLNLRSGLITGSSSGSFTGTVSTGNVYLVGGSQITNTSSGPITLNVRLGNLLVQGASQGSFPSVISTATGALNVNVATGNLTLQGGSGASPSHLTSSTSTTVNAGGNISLIAGRSGTGNYAAIGLGAGPIVVTANGNLSLTAQNNSYALIGHNTSSQTGITVNVGGAILVQGAISGQQTDTGGFAQIGHVATSGTFTFIGDLAVTAGDQITLQSGSFNGSYVGGTVPLSTLIYPFSNLPSSQSLTIYPTASAAQIGNGNNARTIVITSTGATLTNNSVIGTSGVAINTRGLQILAGQGGQGSMASVFTLGASALTLNVTAGDLYLQSGGSMGASSYALSQSGACTATVSSGNLILNAGRGAGASVALPNTVALQANFAAVNASCAGSLTIVGGVSSNSNASLGPVVSGALTVTVGTDCILTSGPETNSYANIGCLASTTTPITLAAGGNLLITAQGHGYAKIGHGTVNGSGGTSMADITVTAGNNIVLNGTSSNTVLFSGIALKTLFTGVTTPLVNSSRFTVTNVGAGNYGFAQIGHLNAQSNPTGIGGNIAVTAGGAIALAPGLKSTAWARIGSGGVTKISGAVDTYGTGTVTAIAGTSVLLLNSGNSVLAATTNSNVWGQLAQIVNPCNGNVTIVADNASGTGSGTGHFLFLTNGYIATPSLYEARVYSSTRIFNYLTTIPTTTINGQTYVAAPLPTATLPQSFANEAWGYTYASDSSNPYVGPNFNLYYKRIGGILLSSDATTSATLTGDTYTFSSPEVVINTTTSNANDLLTALGSGTVVLSTADLAGTSDSNNSLLFRNSLASSTLTWANTNGLILDGEQDVAIDGTISSTSTSSLAMGIAINSGRDTLIGDVTGEIAVANGPITINAYRNVTAQGFSIGFVAGQLVSSGTGTVNPITVTAGGTISLLGGPLVSTSGSTGGITSAGANVLLTSGGDLLVTGGYGSITGIYASSNPITLSVGGNLTMIGSSGFTQTLIQAATVTATVSGNVTIEALYGNSLNALNNVITALSGVTAITVNAGGSIYIAASPSINTFNSLAGMIFTSTGTVSVSSGGDFTILSGTYGAVGSNNSAGIQASNGPSITLSVGGNLTLTAGNCYLQTSGVYPVASIGSVVFTSGGTAATNIIISKIGGNLTINGNRNNLAFIGNGLFGNTGTQILSGNITIQNISGATTLNAYNGANNTSQGFAEIGHINSLAGISTITGNIVVAGAGSITLNGGSTTSAYARIGSGGQTLTGGSSILDSITLMSSTGNLTLNSNTGPALIAANGTGTVTTIIAGNTTLNGASSITSQTGSITLLTGQSQTLSGSSVISNTSPSGISIVADNLYPTPPKSGLGRIVSSPASTITSPGPVRLYSAAQQIDVVDGTINGVTFHPGQLNINTAIEQWFKYYPQSFGGFPFTFFYKTTFQGMINEAVAANATLPQFLPRTGAVMRITKKEDEKKKKES